MNWEIKKKKANLEIISPCFNEEKNVDIFIREFKNVLALNNLKDYLITIVDDGSDIKTKKLYEKYADTEEVRIIELSKNYGHQTAILAGLEYSIGEHIIVIDNDLQDPPKVAIELYKKVLLIQPNDARIYNNIGIIFKELGKLNKAIKIFKKALLLKPNDEIIYNNLGNTFHDQNNLDNAISAFKKSIDLNPNYEQATHLLASLNGNNVEKAPSNYVEELFDNYAENFENHLVKKLKYSTKRVKDIILKYSNKKSFKSVLDLGCGTGLVGLEIKKFSKKLTGVDISKKMISKARSKKIYDELVCKELISYLKDNRLNHELIIASDVLTYFGKCDEIFDLIKNNNSCKKTFFSFTTEHTEEQNYILDTSGRFKHSYEYIENLCSVYNFKLKYFEKNILRENKNEPVDGGLYLIKC